MRLARIVISLSALLLLSSCHVLSHDEQSSASDIGSDNHGNPMDTRATMDKVDLEVRALIDKISDAHTAAPTGSADSFSTLSTSSLRVDDRGRIQLYIHVSAVDEDSREQLNEAGAEIELENAELKVYQAWVPAAAVRSIAAVDTVEKITLPSYARYR